MEPNGSLNVGSIARLCANFEINELRIISPKCDMYSLEARKMALKGKKYLEKCKIYNSLEQAISDCDLVLATCGRIDLNKDFVALFSTLTDSVHKLKEAVSTINIELIDLKSSQNIRNDNFNDRLINLEEN